MAGNRASQPVAAVLPAWSSVLAVVAHPDDESFGVAAVLRVFHRSRARTAVLSLTRGQATDPQHDGTTGGVTATYGRPVAATAGTVGVAERLLLDYPAGALDRVCRARLVGEVIDAARVVRAGGLLVLDTSGVNGPPDHSAASQAVLLAAAGLDLPVLGWTVSDAVAGRLNRAFGTSFAGHPAAEIDLAVPVDWALGAAAGAATARHGASTGTVQRLPMLGDTEHLRWLYRP